MTSALAKYPVRSRSASQIPSLRQPIPGARCLIVGALEFPISFTISVRYWFSLLNKSTYILLILLNFYWYLSSQSSIDAQGCWNRTFEMRHGARRASTTPHKRAFNRNYAPCLGLSKDIKDTVLGRKYYDFVQANRARYTSFKSDIEMTAPDFRPFEDISSSLPHSKTLTQPRGLLYVRNVIKE